MDFTIFKDEIHKCIAEIWVFPRISLKYTENLMRYSEIRNTYSKSELWQPFPNIPQVNLNFKLMDNVNVDGYLFQK